MRFSDEVIASYLNEEWRTPPAVHRLLGSRGAVADIAYVLERLARAGKIEAKHEAAMTGRAGPPVLCIEYYRKLQKWPKSSSVGKMPTSPTVTVTKGRQQPARKKPAPPLGHPPGAREMALKRLPGAIGFMFWIKMQDDARDLAPVGRPRRPRPRRAAAGR